LLLAQVLQITAVHRPMDSDIAPRGKGVGNCIGDCVFIAATRHIRESPGIVSCYERPIRAAIVAIV